MLKWSIEISEKGQSDFDALDSQIQTVVQNKIIWLAEHADEVIHHRLRGLPEDLAGLCKLRTGKWRVFYWPDHNQKILRIYRIIHRSIAYRNLPKTKS